MPERRHEEPWKTGMNASECLNSSVKDKNDRPNGQSSSEMDVNDVQIGQGSTHA